MFSIVSASESLLRVTCHMLEHANDFVDHANDFALHVSFEGVARMLALSVVLSIRVSKFYLSAEVSSNVGLACVFAGCHARQLNFSCVSR